MLGIMFARITRLIKFEVSYNTWNWLRNNLRLKPKDIFITGYVPEDAFKENGEEEKMGTFCR